MDIEIYASPEGGEIRIEDRQVVLTDAPWSSIYVSLFGGNVDDDGTAATLKKQWWGNLLEADPSRRIQSKTQAALVALPAIPVNIQRVQSAVESDLQWLTEGRWVRTFEVSVAMPGRNRIKIEITITDDAGAERSAVFDRQWGEKQ